MFHNKNHQEEEEEKYQIEYDALTMRVAVLENAVHKIEREEEVKRRVKG